MLQLRLLLRNCKTYIYAIAARVPFIRCICAYMLIRVRHSVKRLIACHINTLRIIYNSAQQSFCLIQFSVLFFIPLKIAYFIFIRHFSNNLFAGIFFFSRHFFIKTFFILFFEEFSIWIFISCRIIIFFAAIRKFCSNLMPNI